MITRVGNRLLPIDFPGRAERPAACAGESQLVPVLQPLIASKAAVLELRGALSAGHLTGTCREFGVTHDKGLGIVAWQHGLAYADKLGKLMHLGSADIVSKHVKLALSLADPPGTLELATSTVQHLAGGGTLTDPSMVELRASVIAGAFDILRAAGAPLYEVRADSDPSHLRLNANMNNVRPAAAAAEPAARAHVEAAFRQTMRTTNGTAAPSLGEFAMALRRGKADAWDLSRVSLGQDIKIVARDYDADGDGFVTLDEALAALAAQRASILTKAQVHGTRTPAHVATLHAFFEAELQGAASGIPDKALAAAGPPAPLLGYRKSAHYGAGAGFGPADCLADEASDGKL